MFDVGTVREIGVVRCGGTVYVVAECERVRDGLRVRRWDTEAWSVQGVRLA